MQDRLPRGFSWLISAQFISALADHALLIVAIAHLQFLNAPEWWAPLLKFAFTLAYVFLAPFIGNLADRVCKRRLMAWMNALKWVGAAAMLWGAPRHAGSFLWVRFKVQYCVREGLRVSEGHEDAPTVGKELFCIAIRS
jgi:MFS family permease